MNLDNLTKEEQFFADTLQRAGIPITEKGLEEKFDQIAKEEDVPFANPSNFSPFYRFIKKALAVPTQWMIAFLVREVMPSQFVKTARGYALDLIGWTYDTDRKKAQQLTGEITLYRKSASASVEVPAGSFIRTAPIDGKVYRVFTEKSANFSAGLLATKVKVKAEKEGEAYNLAPGYYSILEKPVTVISKVANEDNWITKPGTNKENDEDYRLRIRAKFTALSDHHVNSVYKSIIAGFGGITYDRIFIDNTLAPRGPGSADANVLFDAGVSSTQFLSDINAHINDGGFHGLGDDLQVTAMPETQNDVELTIYFKNALAADRKAEIENVAEQIIRAAFRENLEYQDVLRVWPNSRFSLQKLGASILNRYADDIDSLVWTNQDIVSGWEVPRLQTLNIITNEVGL